MAQDGLWVLPALGQLWARALVALLVTAAQYSPAGSSPSSLPSQLSCAFPSLPDWPQTCCCLASTSQRAGVTAAAGQSQVILPCVFTEDVNTHAQK